jgi:hypothetical protein
MHAPLLTFVRVFFGIREREVRDGGKNLSEKKGERNFFSFAFQRWRVSIMSECAYVSEWEISFFLGF